MEETNGSNSFGIPSDRQPFQMVRLLRVETPRQFGKGPQASIDDDADQQHEAWNEQAQRHDGPQRAVLGNFVAVGRRLAYRDAASVLSRADQDPPLLPAARNRLESVGKILRQAVKRARRRGIVGTWRQFLDGDSRLTVDVSLGGKIVQTAFRRQRPDLQQDGILKLDRLLERPSEGQVTRREPCPDDEDCKPHKETPAQRGDQHGRSTIHPTPLTLRMAAAPSFLRIAWIRNSTALLSTSSFQP